MRNENMTPVGFVITKDQKQFLQQLAEKEHRSLSSVIRVILDRVMEQGKEKKDQ